MLISGFIGITGHNLQCVNIILLLITSCLAILHNFFLSFVILSNILSYQMFIECTGVIEFTVECSESPNIMQIISFYI